MTVLSRAAGSLCVFWLLLPAQVAIEDKAPDQIPYENCCDLYRKIEALILYIPDVARQLENVEQGLELQSESVSHWRWVFKQRCSNILPAERSNQTEFCHNLEIMLSIQLQILHEFESRRDELRRQLEDMLDGLEEAWSCLEAECPDFSPAREGCLPRDVR